MASTVGGRAKRVRDRQRVAHIILGLVLVTAVYVPAEPGSVARNAVEWFVAPGTVLAGLIMWQWPAIRRRLRRSRTERGTPVRVSVGDNVA